MKAPHKYKLRQRKKLHLGEFRELAFVISADVAEPADPKAQEALLDRLVSDAIEANQLLMAGSINDGQLWAFVSSDKRRGSVTEAQREAVAKWLADANAYKNVDVGSLRDAWYGWDGK